MTSQNRLGSLKCIEWVVEICGEGDEFSSKEFSFQGMKCHLEFLLDRRFGYNSFLYFKRDGELKSALKFTVCASIDDTPINAGVQSIITDDEENILVTSCSGIAIPCSLTFQIIIHSNSASSLLIPDEMSSYKDASVSMNSLSHDFSKLLDEGPYHDVEFICGDRTIKAHKSILCCRSSVFASMLQTDMVEGKTGQVCIKDIDATIFQEFLRSLYTGMLPELTVDSALQFYKAFDKYCVDTLRKQCADFMMDNLSVENACDILILSDQHSDADFKKNVVEYIIEEKIPCTGEKWADFCQDNLKLAVEIYSKFVERFFPK